MRDLAINEYFKALPGSEEEKNLLTLVSLIEAEGAQEGGSRKARVLQSMISSRLARRKLLLRQSERVALTAADAIQLDENEI
jgi:hypothetical protein